MLPLIGDFVNDVLYAVGGLIRQIIISIGNGLGTAGNHGE
jgi:hypothetical protein